MEDKNRAGRWARTALKLPCAGAPLNVLGSEVVPHRAYATVHDVEFFS